MEGMGLKFTPMIVRCPFHALSMFGPMAVTSCSPNGGFKLPPAIYPPPPPTPPSSHLPTPIMCHP